MLQAHRLEEADFRGERFADHPHPLRGNNDLLTLTRPDLVSRGPPRLPRGRRRHHRDQHVHLERGRPGRLRHRGARARDERRGRAARARGGRRVDGPHARPAALRGRGDRPHQPAAVDLARRRGPRGALDHLRRAAGGLRRAGAGPDGGRRRPAAGRDGHRRPERQGGDRRHRGGGGGDGDAPAGGDLGHHHGPQRPHPGRADDRGLLGHDRPRAASRRGAQLRPGGGRDAALPGRAVARGELLDRLLPERRPAERHRRVRRAARGDRPRARRVRGERLRQHPGRVLRHHPGPHPRHRGGRRGQWRRGWCRRPRTTRASRAWSRWCCAPTPTSRRSASAPTSPARGGSRS